MHIRLYRKLQHRREEPESQIFHGRYLDFDYRVIGMRLHGGWRLHVHILRDGQRVRAYRERGHAYEDFDCLRIAGVIVAQQMMDQMGVAQ